MSVRRNSAYSSNRFKFGPGPRRDICATLPSVRDVSQNATSLVMIMSACLVVGAYFTRFLYYPLDLVTIVSGDDSSRCCTVYCTFARALAYGLRSPEIKTRRRARQLPGVAFVKFRVHMEYCTDTANQSFPSGKNWRETLRYV